MGDGVVHGEVLEGWLLAGDDGVDAVAAAQAAVHDGEQAVGIGGQVDPGDGRLLVGEVVEEPGVLVAEPVVVLAPDVAGEQVVERGEPGAPVELGGHLEPLGVLVDHRVDDVDERLVAAEQPVTTGEQVALEPALAGVLGEDLHDPTARLKM